MIAVIGAGVSGITVANHASSKGAHVWLYDELAEERFVEGVKSIINPGVRFIPGKFPQKFIPSCDLLVLSPGVPMSRLPLGALREHGIEVIGEVEYAFRCLKGRIIGITGTNGKSTVTSLTGLILEKEGFRVFTGGNLKDPLTLACDKDVDFVVAELSSFQLESIVNFKPHIALLLNVGEDHLDRYGSFEEYLLAKARIFMNQQDDDYALFNADCPLSTSLAGRSEAVKVSFSVKGNEGNASLEGDRLLIDADGVSADVDLSASPLKGLQNRENIAAASLAALLAGVSEKAIIAAVEEFQGLPHRMEYVGSAGDVDFINDSKGTNVHALASALKGTDKQVVLIAGGKDKGLDFSALNSLVRERVRFLVLIGEAAERIDAELGKVVKTGRASSMDEAVSIAIDNALPGDMVILSPGCSSFDMFRNFEERGRVFKDSVLRLIRN